MCSWYAEGECPLGWGLWGAGRGAVIVSQEVVIVSQEVGSKQCPADGEGDGVPGEGMQTQGLEGGHGGTVRRGGLVCPAAKISLRKTKMFELELLRSRIPPEVLSVGNMR